jgi:LysR family nod box-dependent transcriptional activator
MAPRFDLNLLASLDALLRERSVTAAAEHLCVTQSTMSGMLNRLRAQLADPLLVRVGQSYELTARAVEMADKVHQILLNVESLVAPSPTDLGALTRRFRIMASEFSLYLVLPHMFRSAAMTAPNVTFQVLPINDPIGSVYRGDVDICLTGNTIADIAGTSRSVIRTHLLLWDHFLGLVDDGHPLRDAISVEEFLAYPHAATLFPGVSRTVESSGISELPDDHPPRVTVHVPSFLALGPIVAGTEMIGVVPALLARFLPGPWKLRTLTLPMNFDKAALRALWHSRDDQDSAHVWLRGLATEACAALKRTQGAEV